MKVSQTNQGSKRSCCFQQKPWCWQQPCQIQTSYMSAMEEFCLQTTSVIKKQLHMEDSPFPQDITYSSAAQQSTHTYMHTYCGKISIDDLFTDKLSTDDKKKKEPPLKGINPMTKYNKWRANLMLCVHYPVEHCSFIKLLSSVLLSCHHFILSATKSTIYLIYLHWKST